MPKVPDYSIGSSTWSGLGKLSEECGELIQVLGKLIAYPEGGHPDGKDTLARLHDELGDVRGAMDYFIESNKPVKKGVINKRAKTKLERFRRWHKKEQG